MKQAKPILALLLLIVAGGIAFFALQNRASPILVSNAKAIPTQDAKNFAIYLTLENTGGPDRLTAVKTAAAENIAIMNPLSDSDIILPAGAKPSFTADGAHIMVMGMKTDTKAGSAIPISLEFENAGSVTIKAFVTEAIRNAPTMTDDKDTSTTDHTTHGMAKGVEIAELGGPSKVSLSVEENAAENVWLVKLETTNFKFQTDRENLNHEMGLGHAHLYLNGLKLQRMYGPSARIGKLPKGKHTVNVSLNTKDHRAYLQNGKPLSSQATINIE